MFPYFLTLMDPLQLQNIVKFLLSIKKLRTQFFCQYQVKRQSAEMNSKISIYVLNVWSILESWSITRLSKNICHSTISKWKKISNPRVRMRIAMSLKCIRLGKKIRSLPFPPFLYMTWKICLATEFFWFIFLRLFEYRLPGLITAPMSFVF